MKAAILLAALCLAIGSTQAAESGSIVEPGIDVFAVQTITPDAGIPVSFMDKKGCRFTGEMTKSGEAWLAQLDRKSCPSANGDVIQVVKLVVPLGELKRAVCSGTRVGMFQRTENLPSEIPNSDAETLASHAADAAYACK